jgi:serine/threonine protein kinase
MTSGRDDKPGGPAPPGEGDLLTSEDIFGDMLDDAGRDRTAGAPPAPRTGARKSPIKVKVGEPGPARKATPLSTPGDGGALPEDVAALLDAFSEPGAAPAKPAARPKPGSETLPPVARERPPVHPSTPPAKTPPTKAPRGMDSMVEDLLNLQKPRPGRTPTAPAPAPAPVRAAEPVPPPAARTATKFQAAAPRATQVPDGGGIDLLGLAEEAMSGLAAAEPGAPAERAAAAPPDDTYGPYRLLERVAVGGMAEVFRAKRSGVEGFEKVVAVKRILSHLSDNKEFVDMFIDEAKMVAGLTHPNIVQIFDLGRIERSYYIAMEYVHGRDLRTILRRARERGVPVPLELSAFVVSRVCAALEYAHRKRDERGQPMLLVHRDVSPQNILLSFEGDVKLTDFGIAKAASKATITDKGALRGKLLYMSPEQAWGKPMDRRSDIFSVGIVFYEMLTGQKPFLGTSEMSILETVRECRVAPPTTLNPRIPEKMERIAMKALERDPEVRYQDAGEMHRDLERVLHEGRPPTPRDVTLLLEQLFDEAERGSAVSADWSAERPSSVHGDPGAGPEPPPAPAGKEGTASKDPLTIQKLLKRFGIK